MRSYRFTVRMIEGEAEDLASSLRAAGLAAEVERLNQGTTVSLLVPDGLERRRTRNAGAKRRPLPDGSPLEGMTEEEAADWCRGRGVEDVAAALGVGVSAAYARIRSGRVL